VISVGTGLAGAMSPKAKRSGFEISASILVSLLHGPMTMHGIFSTVNLNLRTAKKYVDSMKSRGLIQSTQGRFVMYSITEKGIDWLNTYSDLIGKDRGGDRQSSADFESQRRQMQTRNASQGPKNPTLASKIFGIFGLPMPHVALHSA
jgi:predicted transcriptional regulator